MTFSAILMLAVGLAMDATAVSAARGLAVPRIQRRHVVSVMFFFGGFQALMPVLGWLLGAPISHHIRGIAHWIAFGLLIFIGGKMLWEARNESKGEASTHDHLFDFQPMLFLALATSIDAFAVGLTLPSLNFPFELSVATIGGVTAVMSAAGLFAGRRFGALLGKRLDLAGGLILFGVAFRILLQAL